jgi:hypothetical protein
VAVPLVPDLILMENARADDIAVFFRVTAAQPAWAVRMPKLPAVTGQAPDNDIKGTTVGIEYPPVIRCIGPGPGAYLFLDYLCLFRGITGNVVLFLFRF